MKAMVGIFEQPEDATMAMDKLLGQGVSEKRISVLTTEPMSPESFHIKKQTKGAEGTALGGTLGAATGAIIAGLTAVGTIATGGAGLLVAGPLVAVLTGAGAGALAGGALGGLIGLGFSEHEIKFFEESLDKGSVIVAVDMKHDDDDDQVEETLEQCNAMEISST